jgi:acyl-CoA synthetase (NDP forming)
MKAKSHFLDYFFYPDSIAVVGATDNKESLNYHLFENLVRFKFPGRIYPVNLNADKICGVKAYPDLESIDDRIDLVVSAVPAESTLDVVKGCVSKNVKGLVLVAGGFSEVGGEGTKMQDEIAGILKQNGIRATGPNTLSPINSYHNLMISFHTADFLRQGNVSFIFQSGMYDPRIDWLFGSFRLGISKLLDLGNKMDINEVDALEYLAEDETTEVIAMHLETIKGDSKRFVQVLKETTMKKPVIILKSGRTAAGAQAAMSHTASIIKENDLVVDSVFRQTGVIRAENLDELFSFAKGFQYIGTMKGNRCLIASFAGGEGVIATDLCEHAGLKLAEPTPEMVKSLKGIFPPWNIPVNPLDLGVCVQFHEPEELYKVFFKAVSANNNVDCLLMHSPSIGAMEPTEEIYRLFISTKESGLPLAVWSIKMDNRLSPAVERFEANSVPVFSSAAEAIKVLSAIYRYSRYRSSLQAN